MQKCNCCHRFHILSFGLALGIVWGVATFLLGVNAMLSGWGIEFIKLAGNVYVGYEATWSGSLIGGVWGFIDAFVSGIIFAAIYNGFACCFSRCKKSNATPPTFSQQ